MTTSTADQVADSDTDADAAIAEFASVRNTHDPELEAEAEPELDAEGNPVEPDPEPEFMTKEEFRKAFLSMHDMPAMLDPDMAVFSIPEPTGHMIGDLRHEGACQVADRLYDRCALDGAPNWMKSLIRSDKEALMAWAGIGVYGFSFISAAKQFKHIKLERAAQAHEAEAANDPFAPHSEDAA